MEPDENFRMLYLIAWLFPDARHVRAPGQKESVGGIPVLDAVRLALVLRLMNLGRVRDVLSFIENPDFHPLQNSDLDVDNS
jgi:hypothetical protein